MLSFMSFSVASLQCCMFAKIVPSVDLLENDLLQLLFQE